MSVNIHGKEYITVAERVTALHETFKDKPISLTTEFLPITDMVVCKCTLKLGDSVFTGTSAANPLKPIEKQSPYEVAETSAVGRALGFAGFGIVEGIASADEIVKATPENDVYLRAMEKEVCKKCGSPLKISAQGKPYCSALCWKNEK